MRADDYKEGLSPHISERNAFDATSQEIREKVMPLLRWMQLHGISDLHLHTTGSVTKIVVNDTQI